MARILLIDDDESMLALEKMILIKGGHEVLICQSALLGLDLLEVHKMDLVIADIQMPRLSGLNFVNTIRNNPRLHCLPVAFISASDKNDDIANAKKLGANFYLLKPIDHTQFLDRVNSFFEENPPMPHQKFLFSEPYYTSATFMQSIQVISINDLGIEALIKQELEPEQPVEIPRSVFQDFVDQIVFAKVIWIRREKNGYYRVFFQFTDHSLTLIRKIQRFIESKNRFDALSKKPKQR